MPRSVPDASAGKFLPGISHSATAEKQLRGYVHTLLQRMVDPGRAGWHIKLIARELTAVSRRDGVECLNWFCTFRRQPEHIAHEHDEEKLSEADRQKRILSRAGCIKCRSASPIAGGVVRGIHNQEPKTKFMRCHCVSAIPLMLCRCSEDCSNSCGHAHRQCAPQGDAHGAYGHRCASCARGESA